MNMGEYPDEEEVLLVDGEMFEVLSVEKDPED
jgi:hypothetical protein